MLGQGTPNFLMLGQKTRVPERLSYLVPVPNSLLHVYVEKLIKRASTAHEVLQEKQWKVPMKT